MLVFICPRLWHYAEESVGRDDDGEREIFRPEIVQKAIEKIHPMSDQQRTS